MMTVLRSVIASEAKQSRRIPPSLRAKRSNPVADEGGVPPGIGPDCFVASLLAMTAFPVVIASGVERLVARACGFMERGRPRPRVWCCMWRFALLFTNPEYAALLLRLHMLSLNNDPPKLRLQDG